MKRRATTILAAALCVALATPALAQVKLGRCETITEPGSYVLKENVLASGDCFVVETSFVTLDLAGFSIIGDGTGAAISDGGSSRRAVTIRNGTIGGFESAISMFPSSGVEVRDLGIHDMAGDGIRVGNRCTIVNNRLTAIEGVGLRVSSSSVVAGNTIDVVGLSRQPAIVMSGGAGVVESNIVSGGGPGTSTIDVGPVSRIVGNSIIGVFSDAAVSAGHLAVVQGNSIRGGSAGVVVVCPSNVADNAIALTTGSGAEVVTTGTGCTVASNAP